MVVFEGPSSEPNLQYQVTIMMVSDFYVCVSDFKLNIWENSISLVEGKVLHELRKLQSLYKLKCGGESKYVEFEIR